MPLKSMHSRSDQRGLTLIELLVAITLGLIVLAVVIGVFVSNSNNYKQNESLTQLQDNARFAMDSITRDLAMAGYWGGVRPIDSAQSVLVSAAGATAAKVADCGPATSTGTTPWLFRPGNAIEFYNYDSGTAVTTMFSCLTNAKANSDAVLIRRASGQAALSLPDDGTTAAAGLANNRFYVKTNRNIAAIIRAPANGGTNDNAYTDCNSKQDGTGTTVDCGPTARPIQYYAYSPHLYYVGLRSGTTTPVLYRRYLDDTTATPSFKEEELAEGVETLQIEWGIDGKTMFDGTPDRYTYTPTQAELGNVVTARVHILVRAAAKGGLSPDNRKFILSDYNPDADLGQNNSGYIRRSFSTTVEIKNFRP